MTDWNDYIPAGAVLLLVTILCIAHALAKAGWASGEWQGIPALSLFWEFLVRNLR